MAHWLSAVQSAQLLLTQIRPLLQLLLPWQLPVDAGRRRADAGCRSCRCRTAPSAVHAAQTWLALQTWPLLHSLLSWQLPITQLFDTQM